MFGNRTMLRIITEGLNKKTDVELSNGLCVFFDLNHDQSTIKTLLNQHIYSLHAPPLRIIIVNNIELVPKYLHKKFFIIPKHEFDIVVKETFDKFNHLVEYNFYLDIKAVDIAEARRVKLL